MSKWIGFAGLALASSLSFAQQTPMQQALPVPKTDFRWDLLLRYDKIDDIPRPVPKDVERTMAQFRPGLLVTPLPWFTIEGRLVAHLDSADRKDFPLADGSSRRFGTHDHLLYSGRNDNYRANSVAIDRLNVQLRPSAGSLLTFGKFENPFETTEVTWDKDLQPEGVAGSLDFGAPDRIHSRATGGIFVGTQLYGDKSRMLGGQYSLLSDSNWPVDMALSLGYYHYENLDVLGSRNFRQNRTVVTNGVRSFASDFHLADVILRLGTDRVVGTPIRFHVEKVHNFGAAGHVDDDGLEAGLQIGPIPGPVALRFTYTYQDLQRDSVMDGFNGDDWYLHSWYRGSLYKIAVPVWRDFSAQATYVNLRHQAFTYDTKRLMIDLVKRF